MTEIIEFIVKTSVIEDLKANAHTQKESSLFSFRVAKTPWFLYVLSKKKKNEGKVKYWELYLVQVLASPKNWYKNQQFLKQLEKVKVHNRVLGNFPAL